MTVLGSTDKGLGRYELTLTHDPDTVATVGLTGSTAHNVSNDSLWLKLDDGETTNWINIGKAVNILTSGPFINILSGVTNVEGALTALDNLNLASLSGGIGGGAIVMQHSRSRPYVETNSTSWTTFAAVTFEGSATYPITQFIIVISRSNANGTCSVRVQDITNNNTIAEITGISTAAQHVESDNALVNIPSGEAVLEVQAKRDFASDGRPQLWCAQLK